MKIVFLSVSGRTPPWVEAVTQDYVKKMSYWVPSQVETMAAKKMSRDDHLYKKQVESESLFTFIREDDWVVACDENGKHVNSIEFSKKMENFLGSGKKRIVFVIGGAFGLTEELLKRAQFCWSLSALTFTHHFALAIAAEQVYRSLTILKNVSYHNK